MTVDSLIDIRNIITGVNDVPLGKVNVKPCRYDEIYMNEDFLEDKLYLLVDQYDERKINYRDFYAELLDIIHPFYAGNWRTFKVLFVRSIFL